MNKKGNVAFSLTIVISLMFFVVLAVYIVNMITPFIWYQKLENIANKYVYVIEKFGYLTRERLVDNKGRFAGIEYNIFEEPQTEKPIAAKPIEEKEKSGKPTSGNAPQLNTNSFKNLENKLYNELNTNDTELLELFREYILTREEMQAPLTETGLEKLIERCSRISRGNVKVQKILLENAIINKWKNVYLPREQEIEAANNEVKEDLKQMFGLE